MKRLKRGNSKVKTGQNHSFGIAAGFPFGEIGWSDWSTLKMLLEDREHFWQGVQPFQDGLAWFTVLDAEVELFADLVGETGDFAGSGEAYRGHGIG